MHRPIRIATVYRDDWFPRLEAFDMSVLRWMEISSALARAGFEVDIIVNTPHGIVQRGDRLRWVPLSEADWSSYDLVKTLFHLGFETLENAGAADHPFIVSKLGSVVGPRDGVPGVHFYGEERAQLFAVQQRIARRSRYVVLLTDESRRLWRDEHGDSPSSLLVPTGVDAIAPPPGMNPFLEFPERIALYLGNLYRGAQVEVNRLWQEQLNAVGEKLKPHGVRLCLVGPGSTDRLDSTLVTYLGAVPSNRAWNYMYYADVGIILAQGEVQHNESSKLYYYLRSGLPAVSEEPVPNNALIRLSGLGEIVPYREPGLMAQAIAAAVQRQWNHRYAIEYMKSHHTWDHRAAQYKELLDSVVSNRSDRNEYAGGSPA